MILFRQQYSIEEEDSAYIEASVSAATANLWAGFFLVPKGKTSHEDGVWHQGKCVEWRWSKNQTPEQRLAPATIYFSVAGSRVLATMRSDQGKQSG